MGTIRDHKTGKALGTVELRMDNKGDMYWQAQLTGLLTGGEFKRFYFREVGIGSGVNATCEFKAVSWVMQALEASDPYTCPDNAPLRLGRDLPDFRKH